MKKTQDQRFLEYAGIITSGKLQRKESDPFTCGKPKALAMSNRSRSAARMLCVRERMWGTENKSLILLCCGQQHKQTDKAVFQGAEVLQRDRGIEKQAFETYSTPRLHPHLELQHPTYRVGGVWREEAETWRKQRHNSRTKKWRKPLHSLKTMTTF